MVRNPTSPAARAHFVVDGSNIATEGRSVPSLQQLNDAVLAFMDEHPHALITVVVDATFGHRIDKKEVKEFDAAVANNELVTPPAGAVGRGDAFVLSIANKAKAGILSNDSFQEFHGQYDWLFDTARLIGGKPVPHVGWVFVERTPVRGPKSRQSVKEAKQPDDGAAAPSSGRRSRRTAGAASSRSANEPLPVPTAPPPGPARAVVDTSAPLAPAELVAAATAAAAAPQSASRTAVNDLGPFLDFVERHPVGTSCTAVIESYSSHGAYARADAVLVYIPLRLMDDPPPRSARSRLKLGEAVTLVVVGYAPERRSVDAALPHMAPGVAVAEVAPAAPKKPRRSTRKSAQASIDDTTVDDATADDATVDPYGDAGADHAPAATPAPRRRGRGKQAEPAPAAEAVDDSPRSRRRRTADASSVAESATAAAAPAKPARGRAKQAATPSRDTSTGSAGATKKAATKKAPAAKKAAATTKKAPAKKAAATTKKAPAKKVAATKKAGAAQRTTQRATTKRAAAPQDGG